jgi:hypothetical protein
VTNGIARPSPAAAEPSFERGGRLIPLRISAKADYAVRAAAELTAGSLPEVAATALVP